MINPSRLRSTLFTILMTAAVTLPVGSAHPATCRGGASADFDGDRRGDLAVGAPYAAVAGADRAGAVDVHYADRRGPTALPLRFSQATSGVAYAPERGDGFAAALAAGDFNGDHCDDLAVGVPDEVFGTSRPAADENGTGGDEAGGDGADGNGAVHVLLGSPRGLRAGVTLTVRSVGREPASDRFGAALAAGDLDHDGADELAVGIPGLSGGGGVGVFGMGGRWPREARLITQASNWVGQLGGATDGFGMALAVGDFDGDGRCEVAAGAPGDGERAEGAMTVLDVFGRKADRFTQDDGGVKGESERFDRFGAALAAADFDDDGRDDLAAGIPGEDLSGLPAAMDYGEGAVAVLYGSPGGLTARDQLWSRKSPQVTGVAGRYDRLGFALAADDLDGDGDAELAMGAPGRSVVHVLRGAAGRGLSGARDAVIAAPQADRMSQFGWALLARSYGPGRASDLVIGAPGAEGFAGTVTVVPWTASGPRGRSSWQLIRRSVQLTGRTGGGVQAVPGGLLGHSLG